MYNGVYKASQDSHIQVLWHSQKASTRRTTRGAKEDDDEAAWREFSVICIKGFLEHIHNTPSARVERENRRIFNSSPSSSSSICFHTCSTFCCWLPKPSWGSQAIYIEFFALLSRHLRFRITIFNFTWALFAGARTLALSGWNASLLAQASFSNIYFWFDNIVDMEGITRNRTQ